MLNTLIETTATIFILCCVFATCGYADYNEYTQNQQHTILVSLESTVRYDSTSQLQEDYTAYPVNIQDAHYIPILTQKGYACAPTSLNMVMLYYGENRSQEFYNDCVKLNTGLNGTFLRQLQLCLDRLGYDSRFYTQREYPLTELKTGDMIWYYAREIDYRKTHISVIDYVENETVIIANPWGIYQTFNISYLESRTLKTITTRKTDD